MTSSPTGENEEAEPTPVAANGGGPTAPPSPPKSPVGGSVASCEPAVGEMPGLRLSELVSGLFQPTFAAAAPGDDTRLFVLERSGAIRIVRGDELAAEPFLDLSAQVSMDNEEGLLGLAFHPRYAENGRFFVHYTLRDPSRQPGSGREVRVSEFVRAEGDPEHAAADSERVLMAVDQPADIHLGGMLAFRPSDGMLYISRGDGGTDNSLDPESWLGKMLRIDVDAAAEERAYGIPPGNMTGDGVLPEIWSMGLRNPWRFSFDSCTSDMYIGDVGQSSFEEVNFEASNSPARNYGWNRLEGAECYTDPEASGEGGQSCDRSGVTLPAAGYDHDYGCSIIGGYVYRGQRIPALRGAYLYADYCSGNFFSLRLQAGQAAEVQEITNDINPEAINLLTAFGEDNAGELYVLTQRGVVYRIDPE